MSSDHPLRKGNVTVQDAQYAWDVVNRICTQVGPGLPASPQEFQRAEIIRKEFEAQLGAENVSVEEFTLSPDAFLGSQYIAALCMVSAAALNISVGRLPGVPPWLTAAAALIFAICSIAVFIFEFVVCFELVDPLFKKKKSVNVIGALRKPGTQNVKRLLIISGHHDSALEFTWLRYTGYGFFVLDAIFLLGLLSVLVMSMIQLAGLFASNSNLVRLGTIGWALLVFPILLTILFVLFFARGRKDGGIVPGAADNLSACALAVSMCRFLKNNPAAIPDDTEIRFITFGSEEAGVRGSRRYVQRHLDELKRLDVRVLNFETIVNPEIVILTSETNGTVKNYPEIVESVAAAAQRAAVPFKRRPAFLGTGSDAGPFSRAGLKATTLIGFNIRQMAAFYHQDRDRPEILTIEPLLNVLKLTLEWIRSGGE